MTQQQVIEEITKGIRARGGEIDELAVALFVDDVKNFIDTTQFDSFMIEAAVDSFFETFGLTKGAE